MAWERRRIRRIAVAANTGAAGDAASAGKHAAAPEESTPHAARQTECAAATGAAEGARPQAILVLVLVVNPNHRKAEQHGFQFPVLLQDRKRKVSREYEILANPAAFLVEEDGVIARDPAVGRDAIVALLRDGRGKSKGGVE